MKQYLELMQDILDNGANKEDRTGTGTRSVFGRQMRFDLSQGFPLVTTKKLHLRSIIHELLWFLNGDTNTGYLKDNGVSIWDEWANDQGDLGPVYGHQWRSWPTPSGGSIDQMSDVLEQISNTPDSRRLIVSAWNNLRLKTLLVRRCLASCRYFSVGYHKLITGNDCQFGLQVN